MRERGRLSGWPRPRLGTLLGALVGVFVLAGLAGTLYVHARSDRDARAQALSEATFAARGAASMLSQDLGDVRPTLAGLAASPATGPEVLAHPANCQLTFSQGGAIAGHLDILRPDGAVACSSAPDHNGAGYEHQPWLPAALAAPLTLAPVGDPRSAGDPSVLFTEPLHGAIAAAFIDLRTLGPGLATELAVPRSIELLVTTGDGRTLLAGSGPAAALAGHRIVDTAFYRERGSSQRPGPVGIQRLFAHSTVRGIGWRVYAGIDRAVALADASHLFRGYLIVIAVALLVVLAATAAVGRLIAAPIVALGAAMRRGPEGADALSARGPAEVAALTESFRALSAEVRRRLSELEQARRAASDAEREARTIAEAYRLLFESNPQPMWIYDVRTLEIFEVNAAAVESYGYSRERFLSMTLLDLRPPEDQEALLASIAAQGVSDRSGPWRHIRADGSLVEVEITSHDVEFLGRPGRLVMATDVTERERLQRRLAQMQRLESLGQLAGGVAHDFNNILAVILNYAAFVEEQVAAAARTDRERWAPVRDDVLQIADAAKRAGRLTHQLLAFARREAIAPEVVDLNSVVRDAEELLRRTLGEHIRLTLLLGDDLRPVLADPGRLEQVLLNLCVNARDAMPDGGTLVVETANAELDAGRAAARPGLKEGDYVRLRVSDTGIGMDRHTLEHAFEPFFTTKGEGHGTGLGLATVYGIVTQMGGDVRLYSEPGIGTTCTVLLAATGERAGEAARSASRLPAGAGRTVLVVEDEDAIRAAAARILARRGFRVLDCADGHEAVALARDHTGPIDALICDVIMPGMMGREVVERIGRLRPGIAVIYMSGYAEPILGSRRALPADAILLEKPFGESELLSSLQEALSRRSANASASQQPSER
ncbi:MAG TPA: ATP-binding protein [Solirubrobacteraceae bacterium]|nr:ATP-binding protein [Solirubrobacteraceae bacterium]